MRTNSIALAVLLTLGTLVVIPSGTAVPNFGTPTTIGFSNQDNNYDSFTSADGQLVVIAHTVDTSNTVVVEVSTDGGANFETRSTNIAGTGIKVAAADAAHILVLTGSGTVIRTTVDGYTWVSAGVVGGFSPQNDIDYADGRYIIANTNCASNSGADCLAGGFANEWTLHWVTSTNHGATWSAAAYIVQLDCASSNAGFAVAPANSVAVTVHATTSWEIFASVYTGCAGSAPFMTTSGMSFRSYVTTNTGSSHTATTPNDQFSPIGLTAVSQVTSSDDANALSFAASGTRYAAQNVAGDQWSFASLATSPLGLRSPAFTCSSKVVVVHQGASGSDRLTYSEASTGSATHTAVTGGTETVVRPYTAYQTGNDITTVYGDLSNGRTTLRRTTNADCAQPIAPAVFETAAVRDIPGIVGFDVDNLGNTVVIRTASGATVRTLNGGTLLDSGTMATNCARTQGVMAQYSFERSEDVIGYLHCSATTSTDVTQVRIRAADLADLDLPGYCDTFCSQNIDDEDIASPEDDLYEIRGMAGFPFDYSARSTDGLNSVYLSWGFSTDDGRIGVNTITFNNNEQDVSFSPVKKIVSSGLPVDQLCSTRDDNTRQDYLYGMQTQGQVAGFSVSYKKFTSNPNGLEPLMTAVFGGVETSQPKAIACARDLVLVIQATGEARLYRVQATEVKPVSLAALDVPTGAASLDPSGSYGAYWAGPNIHFFWTINGTQITTAPAPTLLGGGAETVVGFEMTDQGKALYIATTEHVYRYDTADIVNTTALRPCYTCDGDFDGTPDYRDPDIDGDGQLNNEDPDIDGDGKCNAEQTAPLPAGTIGARYGCTVGDKDDDGDGVPNTRDTSQHGAGGELPPGAQVPCGVPNYPACPQDQGVGKPGNGLGWKGEIIWGFIAILGLALLGWLVSGGLRTTMDRNGNRHWHASNGNPVVISIFAVCGLMISWFLNSFFVIVTIVLVVIGGIVFWLSIGKKASGAP